MNRKKHFLLALISIMLIVAMVFTFVACDRDTGTTPTEEDDDVLLSNGSFANVESETYPKVPTGWTASAGSSSGSQATPSEQGEDLLSGIINVSSSTFKNNAKKWQLSKDANPHKPNNDSKDDNILMINNLTLTAYRYTSSSVSIDKNSYYKVTVNVRTDSTANAFIYVLGDAFAEFKNINTNNQWVTYEMYIEGAISSSRSIQVVLANGWGDKVNGTMSKGVVYYDDITVEKLEKEDDDNYGKSVFDSMVAKDTDSDRIATYSMLIPDGEFNYTSGATQPFSPSKYKGYSGSSESGSNAPSGSSYVRHGVIDTAINTDIEDVTLAPGSMGTKMLFINNLQNTAYGYRSSVPIVVEAGKKYTLSVMVRTLDITGSGENVSLKLSKGTSDKEPFEINGINTNGDWTEFTFNITGNQLANTEVYLELWLGQGGTNESNRWAKGTIFMDKVTLKETTASTYADGNSVDADYSETISAANNMINNGYIMSATTDNGWKEIAFNEDSYNFNNAGKVTYNVVTDAPLPATGITIDGTPYNTALKISVTSPTAYGIVIKNGDNNLTVNKNGYYKISMWVKTDMDEKYDSLGLNVRLMQEVKDKKEDETDKEIASFTNINTREVESNNGYVQLTFYVEGNTLESENVYLEVMFGSGSRFTPDTHVKGDAYITLVGMEEIKYSDYTSASTSTYVKKNSLTTSSSATTSISNGNFNNADVTTTFDNYIKYKGDSDKTDEEIIKEVIDEDGNFLLPTAPSSWTISNKSYLEAINTGLVGNEAQLKSLEGTPFGTDYANFINGAYDKALVISTKSPSSDKGYLTVPTTPETCGCTSEKCIENGICDGTDCEEGCECLHCTSSNGILPVGYTSQSISLSANSFYLISVKVKVAPGSTAYVNINNNNKVTSIPVTSTDAGWQTVRFYISTGLSSTSIKLELYLGDKESKENISGSVAFDNASFTTITEEEYNKINDSVVDNPLVKAVEYVTDSFNVETPSEEGLSTPNNWSGTTATNGSSEAESLVKGVINKNSTRREWLYTSDDEGNITTLPSNVWDYLRSGATDENILAINNIVKNGYSYTNTSDSKNLAKDAYYEISVDVLTYGLQADEYAYISLKLNNVTYTFDLDEEKGVKVNTSTYNNGEEQLGEWRTYTFYVKTPEKTAVSNVTITLGLGKASDDEDNKEKNFVQGYAFFDNVVFREYEGTSDEFDKIENTSTDWKIIFTEEDALKDPEEEKDPENTTSDLLWLYITSGVIGGLIIVVVIGVVIKKYWSKISAIFKKNKGSTLSEYDKNHPNNAANKSNNNAAKKSDKKKSSDNFKD